MNLMTALTAFNLLALVANAWAFVRFLRAGRRANHAIDEYMRLLMETKNEPSCHRGRPDTVQFRQNPWHPLH